MFSDKPIGRREDDELGYGDFAARLVKPLVAWPVEHSLVVGLYGSWGTGKSSVLNLLHSALVSLDDPAMPQALPIRFNPWLYRDTESLLISFFATLAAETKSGRTCLMKSATRSEMPLLRWAKPLSPYYR